MTNNVHRLNCPFNNLVSVIEDLLQKARNREITAVSIVATTHDNQVLTALSGDKDAIPVYTFMGALEQMKLEMNELALYENEPRN